MTAKYANPAGAKWYATITNDLAQFPFSFTYADEHYDGFPAEKFEVVSRENTREERKETTTITLRKDALKITLETAFYLEYGASEWTVWFENTGDENSAMLKDLETRLTFEGDTPIVKGILGDHENLYRPYAVELKEMPACFYTDTGRATHIDFPYFNLEYGTGGAMLAIGWAGTWKAQFDFDGKQTLYRARSVNNLNTFLKPGEKIRTALFVRAPYTVRSENYATNYWRSWYVRCNMPPYDASGRPIEPFSTCGFSGDTGLPNSDGSISERYYTWRPSWKRCCPRTSTSISAGLTRAGTLRRTVTAPKWTGGEPWERGKWIPSSGRETASGRARISRASTA